MKPSKQKSTDSKNTEEPSADVNLQNKALEKITKGLLEKNQKKETSEKKPGKK
jgi:hypothetical protein